MSASTSSLSQAITAKRVLLIALPVVLSNATIPLQGAVDTAIIGNVSSTAELGGVGIGAELMVVFVGVFNFVQIGCSGLAAQALGAGNAGRVLNTLIRSALIGLTIAAMLILFQSVLLHAGLRFFESGVETETAAAHYFSIRIWGAPFELLNMALLGWFAGQELTRRLFQHQLVTTLSNMGLSLLLAVWLGWGLTGVAVATVISQAIGVSYGLWLARSRKRDIAPPGWQPDWTRILKRQELLEVMRLNADIFIRTLLLMVCFAWVIRLGTLQGDTILAANVVLWQFFIITAFALDGFAIAAETLTGQSKGAGDRASFRRAAIISSIWSGALALVFAGLLTVFSAPIIAILTDIEAVRAAANRYALWAALVPIAGFAAFQLDGIFIGATASHQMRNAMILTAAIFLPVSHLTATSLGNNGVWGGIYLFLILRGITMLALYPKVERSIESGPGQPAN